MNQILLGVFSLLAVAMVTNGRPWGQKWGSLAGLAGQPFWFHDTYAAGQWGMFAMCFVYTALYLKTFVREIRR